MLRKNKTCSEVVFSLLAYSQTLKPSETTAQSHNPVNSQTNSRISPSETRQHLGREPHPNQGLIFLNTKSETPNTPNRIALTPYSATPPALRLNREPTGPTT